MQDLREWCVVDRKPRPAQAPESLGAFFCAPRAALGEALHEEAVRAIHARKKPPGKSWLRDLIVIPLSQVARDVADELTRDGTRGRDEMEDLIRARLSSRGGQAELYRQVKKLLKGDG